LKQHEKKPDCGHASKLLSPYIDDMLDAAEADALRAHLKTCAACERERAQLLRMRETLLTISAPPLPAAFDERLRQALAQPRRKAPAGDLGRARPRRLLWSSAAAVFAIGLLSLLVYDRQDAVRLGQTDSPDGVAEESAPPEASEREGPAGSAPVTAASESADEPPRAFDYVADADPAPDPDLDPAAASSEADKAPFVSESAPAEAGAGRQDAGFYDVSGYPARGTTTGAYRLSEKAVCDELMRDKLAGWDYEILWDEKRDGARVYRVNLISNRDGMRFDQEVEIHVSGSSKVLKVYYATEFMGF
jgi:hypothetical protein